MESAYLFKTASDAAVSSAQSPLMCGKTPAEVRSQFQSDMQAAREKLKSDRSQMEKVRDDVKSSWRLAEARSKTKSLTMESARTELKSAMEKKQFFLLKI